ncbi:MAG: amino acid adenylation domain-containing protein [Nostoc sp.]|uniref:amino acid adenylation domain-containing protein n=1 Tax=Nostoc sp. TaxID=1180 RepID=UPI002FFADF15
MTNSIVEFICQLSDLSINLEIDGDRLRCHAPEGGLTPTLRQEIAGRKTEIMQFLRQAKRIKATHQLPIQPVPRDGKLPLSFAQQRLWFVQQLSPESDSYNMLEALRLDGSLNVVALEQSLSELIRRHEVLRTTFPTVDGNPIQHIAAATALNLPIHDLQELSALEQTSQIQEIVKYLASQPFNLAVGPLVQFTLLQLSQNEYVLLLKMHHIIYDGWSLSIFYRELSQLYAAFTQGLPNPLPPLPIQYADFAFWQRQWLTGEILERQLGYWQQQLAGVPGVLELPTDKPRPPIQTFSGGVESFLLDSDLTQRLQKLSQESDATLFMTLLAAFLVLISRYSGQPDIVVGSPIANRNSPQVEQLMGFFANTLALRGNLSDNPNFADFLAQVRQTTLEAYAHQDLPFEILVEKLQPERDLSRNPLVQVMFSLQNVPQSSGNLSGLNIQNIALPIDVKARFDLEVNFWEGPGGLEGVWCYNRDLFEATTIARLAQHFQTLLQAIVANPRTRVAELSLLSPAEHHQLLVEWNNTQAEYPQDKCIHQLFEEQAERTPDAVALVWENQQLTYQQLNCRANSLAHYLKSLGVGADVLVGICVERSIEMVVGLLGILKAGGAYVPLDPEYPSERLRFMLEDAKVGVLLTQQQLVERLPQHQAHLVYLDTQIQEFTPTSEVNVTSEVTPSNLAYVLYTSGSTGKPKAVAIEHHSPVALVSWAKQVFTPQQLAGVLASTSICFDLSVFELFVTLSVGGKVILAQNALHLSTMSAAHQVTLINTVPSAIAQLIRDNHLPPQVSTVNLAGEALQNKLVQQIYQHSQVECVFNLYGPSEDTTYSTFSLVEKGATSPVTIGRPIANTQVYILDEYLQPVPIGVPGELHIGGAGLARGYLNRPDLTQEKFIPHPFSDEADARLYKTGDRARCLPDGNIEYLGRIDNQVKIRGFRIELGEVEAALNQHTYVQANCAIVREDTPGEQRLVAYLVLNPHQTPTTTELRQFLAAKLPGYMIPNAFVVLESLPLTPNGKIDRRALKAPSKTSNLDKFIEPRNQIELQLVQIWSKILQIEKIGVQDNFFDLGGHSLLAPYLITQIQQQFGKDIPLTTFFQNPTIEQLATIVQQELDSLNPSCLVAIQPNGSNLPFFCVPGASNQPFYLYHLGHYLGSDQPLYGFQANYLDGTLESVSCIEDIAGKYIQVMQAVQPKGPYFLGGHSFGGRVAFEMANQLIHQGHEVALLVMIDTAAPTAQEKPILMEYMDWDNYNWLFELLQAVEVSLAREIDISDETIKSLSEEEQLKYVLQHLKMVNIFPPNAETKHLKNLLLVNKANSLSLIDYLPQHIYSAQITLLRTEKVFAQESNIDIYFQTYSEISQDSTMGWSNYSSKPVDVHFVPGNHFTLMAEPYVQIVAERLKTCIDKARN